MNLANKKYQVEKVSGRVITIERWRKNHSRLFIDSRKFGTMIVKAILPDADIEGLIINDEVQLSGKIRIRKRNISDGEIVRDVLVMEPVLEHIIRTKKAAEWPPIRTINIERI